MSVRRVCGVICRVVSDWGAWDEQSFRRVRGQERGRIVKGCGRGRPRCGAHGLRQRERRAGQVSGCREAVKVVVATGALGWEGSAARR